jgi:methionine sulfoxide reductase heme-binding subunit
MRLRRAGVAMTRTRSIVSVVVALFVAEALAVRLGWIVDPLPRLSGPEAWTTSRSAGVIAFAALTLDMVFGLSISTGVLDRWIPRGASVDVHRWLSSVSLSLIAAHALVLMADRWVHYDALDVLVPGVSSYRAGAIAIGIIATYAALVVHASFSWRKRIGQRAWRALHFLSFAIFLAAIAHGLLAASGGHPWLRQIYSAAGLIVTALVVLRVALAVGSRLTSSRRCSRAPS